MEIVGSYFHDTERRLHAHDQVYRHETRSRSEAKYYSGPRLRPADMAMGALHPGIWHLRVGGGWHLAFAIWGRLAFGICDSGTSTVVPD